MDVARIGASDAIAGGIVSREVIVAIILYIIRKIALQPPPPATRNSHGNNPIRSMAIMREYLEGPRIVFFNLLRLHRPEFDALILWAEKTGSIADSRDYTIWQKTMVFLHIVGHGVSYRNVSSRFRMSLASVSKMFNEVLEALCVLHEETVVQPSENYVSEFIELSPRNCQFNGCIGALDGTHIPAWVPPERQKYWYNRKQGLSQNVFAVVKFDLTFTYVLPGAEGSMNDASLMKEAFKPNRFTVPANRYYLGDAGFESDARGVVIPFDGVRYHQRDFEDVAWEGLSLVERFNRIHAGLRSVVERVFGILKKIWPVLKGPAMELDIAGQRDIVFALTGLWNFMRKMRLAGMAAERGDDGRQDQGDLLAAAAARADKYIAGKRGLEIRHQVAIALDDAEAWEP